MDEQIKGPYKLWRHLHTFETAEGGTLVKDHIDYQTLGGRLVNCFFIRPDLDKIFGYRQQQLAARLGDDSRQGNPLAHADTSPVPS